MALVERPRRIIVNKRAERKAQVYIGIDFGTTYTKVSYMIAPSTIRYSIKFTNSKSGYYKPSVVYVNEQETEVSFNYFESSREVKYFKYSMIDSTLLSEETEGRLLKVPKARLFSAFYLGCLIRIIKAEIVKNPELSNYSSEPEWYINIGVPIGNYDETDKIHKNVYNVVLNVGYQFASSSTFSQKIDLKKFEEFYVQHEKDYLSNLNSISELYAEILMYHQDNQVPEGFYAIVDVGGGTVDIATFYKYISKDYGTEVECISQKVESLGVESLINKSANNADSEEEREQIREYLIDSTLNYNNDDYKIHNIGSPYINGHCLYLNRRLFRTAYGTCLMEAKKKQRSLMSAQAKNKQKLCCFLLGGGKSLQFYSQAIQHMAYAHSKAGFPPEVITDIKEYINNNPDLKVKSNRLIISQMLAQPYEKIPPIRDMPWHFDMTEEERVSEEDLPDVDQLYPK